MEALFKIKSSEMDAEFLESIKKLFKGKEVIIRISAPADETEYLSLYEANEKHILENMAAEPSRKFSGDTFLKESLKK